MRRRKILGLLPLLTVASCGDAVKTDVTLQTEGLKVANEVSPLYQSYNIEMAELVGGRFWKPYKDIKGPIGTNSYGVDVTDSSADIYQELPPVNLANERILTLAKGLSPAYVRVSGTWANATYFQGDDTEIQSPPEGFVNILTAEQWLGLLDFVKETDSRLMTSFCVSDGVRDKNGIWTPVEAEKIISFSERNGVRIAAAELFNEPNIPTAGGEFSKKDYSAEDYVKDVAVFNTWAEERAPYMLRVGPGTFGEGLKCFEDFVESQPEMKKLMLGLEDMMTAHPAPEFNVFSYHFYGGVSKRIMPGPPMGILEDDAMSEEWVTRTDEAFDYISAVRDRFAPGEPIWLTETAEAAGGGDPWANTFTDTFRYLYQMGSLAQKGLDVHFHNTLLTSEYSLVDHYTLEPNPSYWAALLWNRLMGTKAYEVNSGKDDFYVFAHNLKGKDKGISYLLINAGEEPVNAASDKKSEMYMLTSESLDSRKIRLNGLEMKMTSDSGLPEISGKKTDKGIISIPSHAIVFLTINE